MLFWNNQCVNGSMWMWRTRNLSFKALLRNMNTSLARTRMGVCGVLMFVGQEVPPACCQAQEEQYSLVSPLLNPPCNPSPLSGLLALSFSWFHLRLWSPVCCETICLCLGAFLFAVSILSVPCLPPGETTTPRQALFCSSCPLHVCLVCAQVVGKQKRNTPGSTGFCKFLKPPQKQCVKDERSKGETCCPGLSEI